MRMKHRYLIMAALYAVSPVDAIPDVIPVVGQIDDALIVPTLLWWWVTS